ncbi:hypothetical protein CIG75_07970 [Tumebacillus algifaecis]|uniref:LysM domain-containing protein n=1 Tax=Tumebacillus algifaecis TaxID=1214604 RepID=A0A223D0C5_9BACL|nr:LysM peptidoglycan-binding domain-containing protein [Tumebacillus algifaecis]ASS74925.1 hypothetical protein CIG75_07970 [Tumebacillus algifaecis]
MSDAEMIPSIRIHVDQQLNVDAVSGSEDVEDATLATEITGFDVEDDAYVLKGALSFTGFLRQEDTAALAEAIPDVLDDRDVFEAGDDVPEAHVLPLHHRLPFVLQVPVAAQQDYQRQHGILDVNPRIGTWNAHVLGEGTLHLRAELIIHGLSGGEGYVFRCGTQEEGVSAQKLDQLLDSDETRHYEAPKAEGDEEFEPPFAPVWTLEQAARHAEADTLEPYGSEEDEWVIESPVGTAAEQQEALGQEELYRQEEEDHDIVFTPDPSLVFPMPEPISDWSRQSETGELSVETGQTPAQPAQTLSHDAEIRRAPYRFDSPPPISFGFDQTPGSNPFTPPEPDFYGRQLFRPQEVNPSFHSEHRPLQVEQTHQEAELGEALESDVEDENAFILEEVRNEGEAVEMTGEEDLLPVEALDETEVLEAREVVEEAESFEATEVVEMVDSVPVEREEALPPLEEGESRPFEAEYQFEDEVSATPPLMQEPKQFITIGPKLSVNSKQGEKLQEVSPIKLSTLLGDSRAPVGESSSSARTPQVGSHSESSSHSPSHSPSHTPSHTPSHSHSHSSSHTPSRSHSHSSSHAPSHSHSHSHGDSYSQAYQKAESYAHALHESSVRPEESYVPVHTKSREEDSFWSGVLTSHEDKKVTMKFKIVQVEDSLKGLADRYNTSVSDLLRANNLQDQVLDVGQILYIPAARR